MDLWRFWAARDISRANCAEFTTDRQSKLRMKFSALNAYQVLTFYL